MTRLYFARAVSRSTAGKATLPQLLAASLKTQQAGLRVLPLTGDAIRVVKQATAGKDEGIEFPVRVGLDVPIIGASSIMGKSPLDVALADPATWNSDILIIFDVTAASASRRLRPPETVKSKFRSGTIKVPNPRYAAAFAQMRPVEIFLQDVLEEARIHRATCSGWGCLVGDALNRKSVKEAQELYARTLCRPPLDPMLLDEPVYTNYQFTRTVIDVTKTGTMNDYVVDRVAQTYAKGSFVANETGSFTICYGMNDEDLTNRFI